MTSDELVGFLDKAIGFEERISDLDDELLRRLGVFDVDLNAARVALRDEIIGLLKDLRALAELSFQERTIH